MGPARRLVGAELDEAMKDYSRTLTLLIVTDDEVQYHNRVELDPHIKDEHGAVPIVHYTPSKKSKERREQLVHIGTDMLRKAGCKEGTSCGPSAKSFYSFTKYHANGFCRRHFM